MSNIFYSQVDTNLQLELNERAQAGRYKRSNKYIKYMTEKIANVELRAYEPPRKDSEEAFGPLRPSDKFPVLGGFDVRSERYRPSGKSGFLNSSQNETTQTVINITGEGNNLEAISDEKTLLDNSRRVGPYIRTVDVSIGDGSMGLLNKATVAITVPNPTRDLDAVESTWMRPGRHVELKIDHPDSAVITKAAGENTTNALLSPLLLTNEEKLQERYPDWDIDKLKQRIRTMNSYTFTGLITNFDLSYAADASVEITISLTGTSDIYTDVSLLMNPEKEKKSTLTATSNIELNATEPDVTEPDDDTQKEFYETLSGIVDDELRGKFNDATNNMSTGMMPFFIDGETNVDTTDRFILFGQPFTTNITRQFVYEPSQTVKDNKVKGTEQNLLTQLEDLNAELSFANATNNTSSISEIETEIKEIQTELENVQQTEKQEEAAQKEQFEKEEKQAKEILTDENRYITIGALIHFINTQVASKQQGIGVLCDDIQISSTYYKHLKSIDPENVLLLPKDPSIPGDMNWYGETGYYEFAVRNIIDYQQNLQDKKIYQDWPGVYQAAGTDSSSKIFPTRIFINLGAIDEIIDVLSVNKSSFKLGKFLESISDLVKNATAGAIKLVLTELKEDNTKIVFADAGYIDRENVIPYNVPMFANDPIGTIVHDFQFSAKLPSSVKNLSYVLNQGTDISEEKIAPYMNFMFNADDVDGLNNIIDDYKLKHKEAVKALNQAAEKYGLSPQDSETQSDLKTALLEYLKYPGSDIRQSQQLTAPIFPFDASFTIDGINGLRYGDVLSFAALPKKYTTNTVFSIIGINHTVGTDGMWTTKVKCIMRPNID